MRYSGKCGFTYPTRVSIHCNSESRELHTFCTAAIRTVTSPITPYSGAAAIFA